jgi:thiamine-phosphate pyrophosphorylase
VLHLGQDDLPLDLARRIVGEDVIIGRSTHSAAQFDAACSIEGLDYLCAGPTWATPTKPGRPAAGLDLLRHAADSAGPRPWFAIGGIENAGRLAQVLDRGARRIVVVRAITEADDPGAATAALLAQLESVKS